MEVYIGRKTMKGKNNDALCSVIPFSDVLRNCILSYVLRWDVKGMEVQAMALLGAFEL